MGGGRRGGKRRKGKGERLIFQDLAHAVLEVGQTKICKVGRQAGELQRKVAVQVQRLITGTIPSSSEVGQSFCSL